MARWGYSSNIGFRVLGWIARVTCVCFGLLVLGEAWYGSLLTEAARHDVAQKGVACADPEKSIPENECVSVFENMVLLPPKSGTRDNVSIALGRAELHQAEGPDSAADPHVEFSREYARDAVRFYISNISSSKRLALTFDDKVEIDASLIFLSRNDTITLPGRVKPIDLTVAALDASSITLVDSSMRSWTASSTYGKPMLQGTDVSLQCQGSFSVTDIGDLFAAARSLAEAINSEGLRSIVSLGGELTCANDEIAMIAFDEIESRVARIVHVKGRGMALIAAEGAPVVVRDASVERKIKRARHLVGKLDLASGTSEVSPVVKEFVAGRTAYEIDFKGAAEGALFDPGTIIITPKSRHHRMVGLCENIDTDLIRRACVDAANTPRVWRDLDRNRSVRALAVVVAGGFLFVWYVLAASIFYKRSGWPRGLEVARQWLVVLTAAVAIGAAAVAIRPPTPEALATGVAWPLPAILAWCLAILATSMAAGVRVLACALLFAVSVLLMTGHQSMAALAFSTGELRLATHFERFSVGLGWGATLLAFVATIDTRWLRERIADLAPILSARGLWGRIRFPLVEAWRRYWAIRKSGEPNSSSAWRMLKASLRLAWVFLLFLVFAVVGALISLSFLVAVRGVWLVALALVVVLGLVLLPLGKLFLGTPIVSPYLRSIRGTSRQFSDAIQGASRMPIGLILVGVLMVVAILAWLILGVETGILNLFQPSEVMKSLVVILLSATALAVLGTTTGLRRAPPVRDLWWALLVVLAVLATVFLAPIVRSDMSPFLILVTLTILVIPLIALVFFVMWAREEIDIIVWGYSRVMPPRLGAAAAAGDRTLGKRLVAEANKVARLARVFLVKPVALALGVSGAVVVVASWYYHAALQDPSWARDTAYEYIAGNTRTPAIRVLSWIELTPQAALNMAEPAESDLPVRPAVVEFPDTGRQVMTARRLIDGAPCYARGYRTGLFDPLARLIGAPNPSTWLELDPVIWIFGDRIDAACAAPAQPIEEVRLRAARMFAIQNDFVAALVFVAKGRDGALRLAVGQVVFLLLMLAIAWRLTSRRHVRENWRVTSTIAAHMVIGFMILTGLHFAISWANTLGLIPVMGQPMTYVSAGQSHFLMVGMPAILIAVIASRLTHQVLPGPANIVPEPSWIASWSARKRRRGQVAPEQSILP